MDDDEDEREFSKSIVYGFFEQAENTFSNMDKYLDKKDLRELSRLGHFLKGSSATLGLTHIRDSCEKIQHLGHGKDEKGEKDESEEVCLGSIRTELEALREEYAKCKKELRKFYKDNA
ncbi:MAG: hypothetical protein Q9162_006250 [Coniocarpon cinnabarinum]